MEAIAIEVNLNRDEIWLIVFALDQKVNLLKKSCMNQQNIINSLKKSKNSYDVRNALETAEMLLKDSQADLKKHIEVYNKFKKL